MTTLVGKGDTFENDMLKLIFWGTTIANLADNAASSPLTNLYMFLAYADPTEEGTAATNEITAATYGRVAILRSSSGFDITGNTVTLHADVTFPRTTGAEPNGSHTATHWGLTTASSGATKVLYGGALDTPIDLSVSGIAPVILTAGTAIHEG